LGDADACIGNVIVNIAGTNRCSMPREAVHLDEKRERRKPPLTRNQSTLESTEWISGMYSQVICR